MYDERDIHAIAVLLPSQITVFIVVSLKTVESRKENVTDALLFDPGSKTAAVRFAVKIKPDTFNEPHGKLCSPQGVIALLQRVL